MNNKSNITLPVFTKENVFDFLKDRNRHEQKFAYDKGCILLLKSSYDEETDFIYSFVSYLNTAPHTLDTRNGKPELEGIYSHVIHEIAMPGYHIRNRAICSDEYSSNKVVKRFANAVQAAIVDLVNGKPVPMTDEHKKERSLDRLRAEFIQSSLDEEVRRCFCKDSAPSLHINFGLGAYQPSAGLFVKILNHFEEAVREKAEQYILGHAVNINERLWQIEMIQNRLREIENEPGIHHTIKRIANSVSDQKMVNLEIAKNGIEMSCKIEAAALKRCGDYYSSYSMDAPSRKKFEEAFGWWTDLMPQDIRRITYGKKVLYQADENA